MIKQNYPKWTSGLRSKQSQAVKSFLRNINLQSKEFFFYLFFIQQFKISPTDDDIHIVCQSWKNECKLDEGVLDMAQLKRKIIRGIHQSIYRNISVQHSSLTIKTVIVVDFFSVHVFWLCVFLKQIVFYVCLKNSNIVLLCHLLVKYCTTNNSKL